MKYLNVLSVTAIMLLVAGCDDQEADYLLRTTATGVLVGGAVTGDEEGAIRGGLLGAGYGVATMPRQGQQSRTVDRCSSYRHNQGAYAACKRGEERSARQRQRELENQAYSRGRRGY